MSSLGGVFPDCLQRVLIVMNSDVSLDALDGCRMHELQTDHGGWHEGQVQQQDDDWDVLQGLRGNN